jgi:CBS domain-containing protein
MDDEMRSGSRSIGQCGCLCESPDGTEHLLARDVMQYGVLSIDEEEPIHAAVEMLVEHDISGLPVTRGGRLTGMVSGKDLLAILYKREYLPGRVRDYMKPDVVTSDVDTKLSVIHKQLVEHAFRRVPILSRGQLVGMITRTDIVRVCKERFRPATETPAAPIGDELLAEDVMKHGLLTIGPNAPLYDAMNLISEHHITGLPVVDEGMNLLGIITEKDLLDCVDKPEAVGASVGAYMVRNVVAFSLKTSLRRICLCLVEEDFHRVPILNGTRLVGIISRSDILRYRASTFRC